MCVLVIVCVTTHTYLGYKFEKQINETETVCLTLALNCIDMNQKTFIIYVYQRQSWCQGKASFC